MQEDRIPKVFISYSWDNEQFVLHLANRLCCDGIDVLLDKWDLKPGQDKYVFMEKCVNDEEVSKVLIILNESYTKKANSRTGGVGDETIIISSEVYNNINQEKFIPVISEVDEYGKPYCPAYIKSKIYIDLSNEDIYEDNYAQLVRDIFNKPLYRKPPLGVRPKWLDNDTNNYFSLHQLSKNISKSINKNKTELLINKFCDLYVYELNKYFIFINEKTSTQEVFNKFSDMKGIRDVFLNFIQDLYQSTSNFSDNIITIFENIYNKVIDKDFIKDKSITISENCFEIYKIHFWELFICTITFLLYNKSCKEIGNILSTTFFLKKYYSESNTYPYDYKKLHYYSQIIEEFYKPKTQFKNHFTLIGHSLCNEREFYPIYTGKNLANADLFLYQVYEAFKNDKSSDNRWFPICYIYADIYTSEWLKLKSKKFCNKIFDIFNINSIEELKNMIQLCSKRKEIGYQNTFEKAHNILYYINIEDIGIMN